MGRNKSIIRAASGVAVATAIAIFVACPDPGIAQTSTTSSSVGQALQSLLNGGVVSPQQNAPQTVQPSVTTQQTIIAPTQQQATSAYYAQPQSRLEEIMSDRAGRQLSQFGYSLLGSGQPVISSQVGQVQDDYVLGPGDLIDIALRGQNTSEYRIYVDRDGRVIIPGVAPVSAGGRHFGDFRADLINAIHKAFVATDAYISVAQVRQVSVLVSGAVNNPGVRNLTALSTPLDAILVSGGVQKTGSLRNIKIMRGGKVLPYDLYDVLTQRGNPQQTTLADGDRIIVPPLGATVAVTGWVRVQGIYELPAGASGLSAKSLIALAGGLEVRGRYRLVVMRVSKDGRQEIVPLPNEGSLIHDSEILYAEPAANEVTGGATLSGGQSMAGQFSVTHSQKLSDMLKEPGAMGDSPYALLGVIVRRDPNTYVRSLVAFAPASVLEGVDDMDLASNDIVRVFSMPEAQMLLKTVKDYQDQQEAIADYNQNPQLAYQTAPSPLLTGSSSSGNNSNNNNNNSANAALLASGQQPSNLTPAQVSQLAQTTNPTNPAVNPAIAGQLGVSNSTGQVQSSPQQIALARQNTLTQQYAAGSAPQNPALASQYPQLPQQPGFPPGALATQPMQPMQPPPPTIVGGINLDQEIVPSPPPVASNQGVENFTQLATQLNVDPQVLINFLIDHEVSIEGAVNGPGTYLVGPHVNLKDLVSVAGGTTNWADESGVELLSTKLDPASGRADTERQVLPLREASLQNYMVQPHDEIHFNQLYAPANGGTVTLVGEVRSPGTFTIMKGERLSQLLVRAGGLTDIAYPYGTVFLRKSAAANEEIGFQKAADEVQKQFLVGTAFAASSGANGANNTNLASLSQFATMLREQKPLGRISIQADPSVLAAHPEEDPILQPGDFIDVPVRPNTVTVLGSVNQPGSFVFKPGMRPQDYIDLAGGYATYTDEDWTYVVYPDGTAQRLDSSWFSFNRKEIPPGSVIWVPRDILPLNWQQLGVDIAKIFADMSVSGAYLYAVAQGALKANSPHGP